MIQVETPVVHAADGGDIVLDGRCTEDGWAAATRTELGAGVTLLTMADARRVYVCAAPTGGGYGTFDLYLASAPASPIVDLHVSVQSWERTLTPQGWVGRTPQNFDRWYGTPVPLIGIDTDDQGRSTNRHAVDTHRELAIEKSRFGPLPWRFRVEVRSLGTDQSGRVAFPPDTSPTDPSGWAVLSPPPA